MTLLDDRLISPNGLEIARFFDSAEDIDDSAIDAQSLDIDDDGFELAFSIWN